MRSTMVVVLGAMLGVWFLSAVPVAAGERFVTGSVFDATGSAIAGARVAVISGDAEGPATVTDANGRFRLDSVPATARLRVSFEGFEPATIEAGSGEAALSIILQAAGIAEEITVLGAAPVPTRGTTATKTDSALRDVPQSITVISSETISQQGMRSMADVVRYVPGIGIAQGEGNRDTPVFRGISSTSDFFVDGIRDDVQYFRDLYNVERIEALKGPNAMMFGRGGVGGVLNRVTRQADWAFTRELSLQAGSWNSGRMAGDLGRAFGEKLAARVTGVYEHSESYRDGYRLQRHGLNPTIAFVAGPNTLLRAGYEYFHDDRTADRGIPSFAGRPVATNASTFFGNSDLSGSKVTVHALSTSLVHQFNEHLTLSSRIGYADYDKFYQNVFPGAVDARGENVSISAYNNATKRRNLFTQTDLVMKRRTGGIRHTLLAGVETGRQITDNFRNTGYFSSMGANVLAVMAPLSNPTTSLPLTFRQSATDADNHGIAESASIYLQDQIELSSHFQVIAGLRYDDLRIELRNHRNGATFASHDGLVSPRLGLIYKPIEPVSVYVSYGLSYLPRAGEQLSSLALTNQALDPEEFCNYEVGAKWDVARRVEFTLAVYRLDRGNVAVPDPSNPAVTTLVDGQRSEGVEWSVNGNISSRWSVVGAYAWQNGEILRSLSSTARAGARLAQLPEHSFSLWNKYEVTPRWGVGVGVIHRGAIFTSTDNTVIVPGFTRADAAVFFAMSPRLRAQLNAENLLGTKYYASAHSNTNITPGSPRALRLSWNTRF